MIFENLLLIAERWWFFSPCRTPSNKQMILSLLFLTVIQSLEIDRNEDFCFSQHSISLVTKIAEHSTAFLGATKCRGGNSILCAFCGDDDAESGSLQGRGVETIYLGQFISIFGFMYSCQNCSINATEKRCCGRSLRRPCLHSPKDSY